jgi:hypothetical protein
MREKGVLTKVLAITGTVFTALPVLTPIILSLISLIIDGEFNFDFFMPAELFLMALAGGLLLLWAALRARSHQKWIGFGLGAAFALLAGGLILARITGLASGDIEPTGIWYVLVMGSLVAYSLMLVVVLAGGVLLLRGLFRSA